MEMKDHPYDFVVPDFSGELDAARFLAAVPDSAKVKGIFFKTLLSELAALPEEQRARVALPRARYIPFTDYPLREHMELSVQIVPLLFPGVPTRQAFREMGWAAFPDFTSTLIGKVIFGDDAELDHLFNVGPRAIVQSIKPGMAVATQVAEAHWRFELYDIYGMLDPYYIGVFEGPIRQRGFTPDVRIHSIDISNAVLDVRWS